MKKTFRTLEQPLVETVESCGLRLEVTNIGNDREGQVSAQICATRDGAPVASDLIRIDREPERRKFIRRTMENVNEHDGGVRSDDGSLTVRAPMSLPLAREIEQALFSLNEQIKELGPPQDGNRDEAKYVERDGCIVYFKPTYEGSVPHVLTNFTAKIISDIVHDDGVETRREFEISATVNGRDSLVRVASNQFLGMGWVTEFLGAEAIINPGPGTREHTRCAIQKLSGSIPQRQVYGHTGWRLINGVWLYLHAGGAIGSNGPVDGIEVDLPEELRGYRLKAPGSTEELIVAVRASLDVLNLAPHVISVPIYCAVLRSVISGTDVSIHVSGPTGQGKTSFVATCLQHFGAIFDDDHMPASWQSTGNALEGLAFALKDACLAIDDFAPPSNAIEAQRMHRDADRYFRAQGNCAGKSRMRADASLRPTKSPRGTTISTGEDIPRGQSIKARLLIVQIGPGDINFKLLTECQRLGKSGLYAKAMSGFISWLANDFETVRKRSKELALQFRDSVSQESQHRRTPSNIAELAVGLDYFLRFAAEIGAIDEEKRALLWQTGWQALGENAAAQETHQLSSEPTRRFLELLSSVIASGQAHLANPKGTAPESAGTWGWRSETVGASGFRCTEWRAQGARVGWVNGEDVFLDPDTSYSVVQKLAREGGEALSVGQKILHKRLQEKGLLASTEPGRNTLTVRKNLEGTRRSVLHLRTESVMPAESDEPDDPEEPHCEEVFPETEEKISNSGQFGQFGQFPNEKEVI